MGIEGKYSHKINDYVMYRQNGICRISDIRTENLGILGENLYYILNSVYDERNTVFVPVDSQLTKDMHHLLSPEEIDSIIKESEKAEVLWLDDDRERAQLFDAVLKSGDRAKILWVVKLISIHKIELESQKKKLHASDERTLSLAHKHIVEEFAFVLGIDTSEVIPYITEKIRRLN